MRLERYAEVLAHVVYFRGEDLHEVLARLGVTPADWARADAVHTAELALSGKRNQGIQALRFSSVFARTRRSLEAKRPSLASLGPAHPPPAGEAAPAHPPPPPAPPPLVPPQGPSFVSPRSPLERDEISPWAASARARSAGAGNWPPVPPRAEAASTSVSPPAPPRLAEAPPAPSPSSAPMRASIPRGTADIAEFVPRPDLPFQAGQAQAAGQNALEGKRLQRFDPRTGKPLDPLDPPLRTDAPPVPGAVPGDDGSR
ncbi:hypothetical protein [Sorangium sp. So ce1097]|uniref:hypothetical protein n=1 Tax=Sorangium sp. So ce1097 TaxID=3133330 RepID=UPI003F62C8E2